MGVLRYGSDGMEVDIDDRSLAHLQIVMTSKLRRGEAFLFSWTNSLTIGSGRSSIWIDPAIPLYFRYFHNGGAEINREWLEALMDSANTAGGLNFSAEPSVEQIPPGRTA
ncbi:MAG: ATP-dependent DNA ligase [Burkholderiaceae bacterium]|nr:ATP-dependent DNA ligase [Microbacteriaceae bacterium]